MTTDTLETPEVDLSTDDAVLSALDEHKVGELVLEPYSLLRQTVAQDLRDPTPRDDAGYFFNAVVTVWICTLKPRDVLKAHSDSLKAKEEAFIWAEARGYSLFNWKPVVEAYNRMQREWYATSQAHIEHQSNGDAPDPNAGGQPE
jgi:hypothetical protein